MPYTVDFTNVSAEGLESPPVAQELASLRAGEARYFKNRYDHVFTVDNAQDSLTTIERVHHILANERNLVISAQPLQATSFEVGGYRMDDVFYESGLAINAMYAVEDGGKLSEGMAVPEELASWFKFARQKSKLAGVIRGSYFGIRGEY